MKRIGVCLALTACAPAAPPSRAVAPPDPTPPLSAAPSASGTPSLPRPASVSVEDKLVIGLDGGGRELFRGAFTVTKDVLRFKSSDPARTFQLPLRRFPGARGDGERALAVGADGVALVGGNDGSLLAVDYEGKPRFQLGVRWAIADIQPRLQGGYDVTTVAGHVIVDPSQPSPVEPPPRPPAPLTYVVHPPVGGRAPDLVIGPNDAWALEERSWKPLVQRLHRFDGKAWKEVPMRELEERASDADGARKLDFAGMLLGRGPKGQPVLVGVQRDWESVDVTLRQAWLRVFEWDGHVFKERSDIAPAYAKTRNVRGHGAVYAAGPGDREIVCLGEVCLARGLPPSFRVPGGKPPAGSGAPGWVSFSWLDGTDDRGSHATLFAGPSLYRVDHVGLSGNGKKLVDFDDVWKDTEKSYPKLPDPYSPVRDDERAYRAGELVQGLWASGPDDVWASIGRTVAGSVLFRWNGAKPAHVPCPLSWVDSIGGSGPNDVWLSGEAVAHYDGREVRRIPGIPAGRVVGGAGGDVWIRDWHVTQAPGTLPDLRGTPASVPQIASPSLAIDVTEASDSLVLEPVTLTLSGEAPLSAAVEIEEGPGGLLWLHDHARIVELSGANARVIHRVEEAFPLECHRCIAPRAPGEGALLMMSRDDMVGLRRLSGGRLDEGVWLPDLLAVAAAPNGDVWAVSAADDSGVARAFVSSSSGIRNVSGLTAAAYSDVAVRSAGDVWFSGGLTTTHDGVRAQPAGEGILVHFDGQGFARYRGPEGALLSVAAVGPAEAWAVGYDGGIVHVKGGVASAFHLERAGEPLRVALRAVAATGPDDVWISGDGSTLLRWDGKDFTRMDLPGVGVDAALTAVVPPRGDARGWLAGPRGLWRMRLADKAPGRGQ